MKTKRHARRWWTRPVMAAVVAGTVATLGMATIAGTASADQLTQGSPAAGQAGGVDPTLTQFASVPLTTPGGQIQAVIYDGANTENSGSGGSLPLTLTGFTVPPSPFKADTTAVVADGQVSGNSFSFGGTGPALSDSNAFPGKGPCPSGWSFGCLWDNNNYDVTSTFNSGDTSANATVGTSGSDCITWVAQALATGPSAAFANAGYVANGVGLRDQGSGSTTISGIPSGSYIARAYLFWAGINATDPGGAMQINGQSVTAALDGTSGTPCWPTSNTGENIFTHSANVTQFVHGNGTYTFSGYPTGLTGGQDPWADGNGTAYPLMEGATLVVVYGQMSASGVPVSATEGAPFSGTVATFTEPDASAPAGQYSATINWGDSSSSAGTVSGPAGGPFTVSGVHTYAEEGSDPVSVTITDDNNSTNTAAANSTATVSDADLTPASFTATGGTEGDIPGTASFTFIDANPGATTADFTSLADGGNGGFTNISWGDGTTSTGTLSQPGGIGTPFTLSSSHTYAEEGTYALAVNVRDDGGSTTTSGGLVTVADAPLTAGTLSLSGGVEGVSPGTASFTFADANSGATTADYTVAPGSTTINWGDGSPVTTGTVGGPTGGHFTLSGNHQYAEEGTYTVTVNVADDGGSMTSATGTVTVADAPITASCATPAVSLQSFSGTVASLSDANTGGTAADFIPVISGGNGGSTTINWGDGSATTGGTFTGSGGSYSIAGSHTYSSTGFYNVTVTVQDDGGSTSTTPPCTVLVYAFPPGGSFVIGNGNSANGTAVAFWGAQWAKNNSLSGGPAPSSFKGFEDSAVPPVCGMGWTTDPGNSTPPPNGPLPAYMGVIVSSSISKSGSAIAGDTAHIVVVNTDSGYAPDPGHAGTGTVVAKVC